MRFNFSPHRIYNISTMICNFSPKCTFFVLKFTIFGFDLKFPHITKAFSIIRNKYEAYIYGFPNCHEVANGSLTRMGDIYQAEGTDRGDENGNAAVKC